MSVSEGSLIRVALEQLRDVAEPLVGNCGALDLRDEFGSEIVLAGFWGLPWLVTDCGV